MATLNQQICAFLEQIRAHPSVLVRRDDATVEQVLDMLRMLFDTGTFMLTCVPSLFLMLFSQTNGRRDTFFIGVGNSDYRWIRL